jgi:hypothetical protein
MIEAFTFLVPRFPVPFRFVHQHVTQGPGRGPRFMPTSPSTSTSTLAANTGFFFLRRPFVLCRETACHLLLPIRRRAAVKSCLLSLRRGQGKDLSAWTNESKPFESGRRCSVCLKTRSEKDIETFVAISGSYQFNSHRMEGKWCCERRSSES